MVQAFTTFALPNEQYDAKAHIASLVGVKLSNWEIAIVVEN